MMEMRPPPEPEIEIAQEAFEPYERAPLFQRPPPGWTSTPLLRLWYGERPWSSQVMTV